MPSGEVVILSKGTQSLVRVMAADDLRDPGNFVAWLICREAQRRGLLPAELAAHVDTPNPQAEVGKEGRLA